MTSEQIIKTIIALTETKMQAIAEGKDTTELDEIIKNLGIQLAAEINK